MAILSNALGIELAEWRIIAYAKSIMTILEFASFYPWAIVVLFSRIGTFIMLLPGFGEIYVTARIRVLLGLFIATLSFPLLHELIPEQPQTLLEMMIIISGEVVAGAFLGLLIQWLVAAMHVVGTFISSQAGLSSAMLFDPSQGEQSTVISSLLGMIVLLFIFTSDLHYLFLEAILDSFHSLPIGKFPYLQDETMYLSEVANRVMLIALTLAAPQWIVSIIMSSAAGVLSRLMPSLQIFFLITPVQILVSFTLLGASLAGVFEWYSDYMVQTISTIGN